jgi:hypothetical protein
MTSKSIYLIALLPLLLACFAFTTIGTKETTTNSEDWILAKDKNETQIYTRTPADSQIKELKVVSILSCNVNEIESFIDNINYYPKWQANIASVKLLKIIDTNTIILMSKKSKNTDNSIVYKLSCVPNFIIENPDFIRVKKFRSLCKIEPLQPNKVAITFECFGDPEGYIPDNIINLFIVESPYSTFINLKKIIEKHNH